MQLSWCWGVLIVDGSDIVLNRKDNLFIFSVCIVKQGKWQSKKYYIVPWEPQRNHIRLWIICTSRFRFQISDFRFFAKRVARIVYDLPCKTHFQIRPTWICTSFDFRFEIWHIFMTRGRFLWHVECNWHSTDDRQSTVAACKPQTATALPPRRRRLSLSHNGTSRSTLYAQCNAPHHILYTRRLKLKK